MKDILKQINPLNEDETLNVIIEIQKGSKNKYELDKKTGLITLDRVMYTAQDYPFDYGFVPNTLWHDGDPLDVVLLTTYPLLPGVLVKARPVAYLDMIDEGESDVKIICVPVTDPRWQNIHDLKDLNPHTLDEINHFFETYKKIQKKIVEIPNTHEKKEALKIIQEAIKIYKNVHGVVE